MLEKVDGFKQNKLWSLMENNQENKNKNGISLDSRFFLRYTYI